MPYTGQDSELQARPKPRGTAQIRSASIRPFPTLAAPNRVLFRPTAVQSPPQNTSIPKHKAMFHAWVSKSKYQNMFRDGRVSTLTTNPHQALQSIRISTHEPYLRADSIYINQDDAEEKAQQAATMSQTHETQRVTLYDRIPMGTNQRPRIY